MPVTGLYGLRLRSAIALPGVPLPDDSPVDVTVHLRAMPPGADRLDQGPARALYASEHEPGETPALVADLPDESGLLRLRYAEGIRFHLSARGDEVWCDWEPPLVEADAVTFLLGPVMGAILRRRGIVALHASAVEIGGLAWAFVGPGGSGKSTLAAALARAGHPLVTEDLLALRPEGDAWLAAPGYRAIRLWDDSAGFVAPREPLPALTPNWRKRELDLVRHALPFAVAAVPLAGIFVLEDFGAPGEPPRVRPMTVQERRVELIANVYANQLATPSELARELVVVSPLSSRIRGWWLRPGTGSEGLSRTVHQVELVTRDAVI